MVLSFQAAEILDLSERISFSYKIYDELNIVLKENEIGRCYRVGFDDEKDYIAHLRLKSTRTYNYEKILSQFLKENNLRLLNKKSKHFLGS